MWMGEYMSWERALLSTCVCIFILWMTNHRLNTNIHHSFWRLAQVVSFEVVITFPVERGGGLEIHRDTTISHNKPILSGSCNSFWRGKSFISIYSLIRKHVQYCFGQNLLHKKYKNISAEVASCLITRPDGPLNTQLTWFTAMDLVQSYCIVVE